MLGQLAFLISWVRIFIVGEIVVLKANLVKTAPVVVAVADLLVV